MPKRLWLAGLTLAALAVAPAAALVRLGGGVAAGFAFPVSQFDNDAKTAPAGAARLYLNVFHWLSLEAGGDFDLKHAAEGKQGWGETRGLWDYRAGLIYKVDMGVVKPFVAGGGALYHEKVRLEKGWKSFEQPGFYVGPGIEYYFDEPFLAFGSFQYNRIFDDARKDLRDTQFLKLDFGLAYFVF